MGWEQSKQTKQFNYLLCLAFPVKEVVITKTPKTEKGKKKPGDQQNIPLVIFFWNVWEWLKVVFSKSLYLSPHTWFMGWALQTPENVSCCLIQRYRRESNVLCRSCGGPSLDDTDFKEKTGNITRLRIVTIMQMSFSEAVFPQTKELCECACAHARAQQMRREAGWMVLFAVSGWGHSSSLGFILELWG